MKEKITDNISLESQQIEYVLSRGKNYNEAVGEIAKIFGGLTKQTIRDYRDSVRNLAIICGAIATFSLVLFGAEIDKITILLIIGVSLLLMNVMIAFTHLFSTISKDSRTLTEQRLKFLRPMQDRTRDCIAFLRKEISFDEWLKKEVEFLNNEHKKISEELILKKEKLTYTDDVLIIIFIIAISLILLSFLLPNLSPLISNLFLNIPE